MKLRISTNVALGNKTTLGVGGAAAHYVEAKSDEQVYEALAYAKSLGLALTVLGGGSNVVVADRGIAGLVLRPRIGGISTSMDLEGFTLDAGAGVPWDALVAISVEQELAGLECLSGIPGDVGAAPIQNVGAYGQEVSETLTRVDVVDRTLFEVRSMTAAECGFGYRDSVFKREHKDRFVILKVACTLVPGGEPAVRYPELERALGDGPRTLASVREAVLALRRSKSMVLDPADENGRSAGSFFMNPVVDAAVVERVRGVDPSAPTYPAEGGRTKLAAGWLIERAGLAKGTAEGSVGLSTRHALAIVNRGGATAADIVAFARRVQDRVLEVFGVKLRPEPVFLGFSPEELGGLTTTE